MTRRRPPLCAQAGVLRTARVGRQTTPSERIKLARTVGCGAISVGVGVGDGDLFVLYEECSLHCKFKDVVVDVLGLLI